MDIMNSSDFDQWDEFVRSCDDGTLFHTTWWYRAWGLEPTVRVLTGKNGRIEGGICYCEGRRFTTRAIVRPPMTARNGPVFARSKKIRRHAKNTHDKKMMLAVIESLPKLGVYDFILRPSDTDTLPFLWNGFEPIIGYTYVIPHGEMDTWMRNGARTLQGSFNKACREADSGGFAVDDNPPFDEVLATLKETAKFKGYATSHWADRMATWWEAMVARKAAKAYLLRDGNGVPVSANVVAYDDHCAYNLASGVRNDMRRSCLPLLTTQRMIRDAHQAGLDFDFEGSVLPGVEPFFRSLGGELRPLYRLVKIPCLRSYLIWSGYRYWTGHRRRPWVSHG